MDSENLYESPLLTNVATMYRNREYVADRLAPAVTVPKKTFKYLLWDRASTFKPIETQYGPNGQVNEMDFNASKEDGSVDYHGLGAWTDQDEIDQAGPGIPVQTIKTQGLTNQILLNRELRVSKTFLDTGTYDAAQVTSPAGAAKWDQDTSDPEADVDAARDAMVKPGNVLWGSRPVISRLRRHPKIVDRVKYTHMGKVPLEALADLFEVEEIVICTALYDTAAQGQAESRSFIWGKSAGLIYRNPNPTPSPMLDDPTFASLPTLGQPIVVPGGKAPQYAVYTAPRDPRRGTGPGSEFVKVDTSYKLLIQAQLFGWLFNAVMS